MVRVPPDRGRGLFSAVVTAHKRLCREHYLLTVRLARDAGFPPTEPGAFIQLGCRPPGTPAPETDRELSWSPGRVPDLAQADLVGPTAYLRRPFSLADRRDTPAGPELDVIYRVVGVGTAWLEGLTPGDNVELIGPLGNRFTLPEGRSIGLLVGGGVGIPPMFYLAAALRDAGWEGCGFLGAVTRDLLSATFTDTPPDDDGEPARCVAEFDRHGLPAVVTTDDGSLGLKGLITEGVARYIDRLTDAQRGRAVVYTCGPEPMMRAVCRLAAEHDIPAQVCVEQAMACGMGTCQSCVVRTREDDHPHGRTPEGVGWRYRLACTDGPVFDGRDVIWGMGLHTALS